MCKLFLSALIFFCSIISNAQILIRGQVTDSKSGLAVANASVYLNNTSIGTVTNGEGRFVLNVKSTYTAQLIISSIGYQPLFYDLNAKDALKEFYTFQLTQKENSLKEVVITNDATRQSWLRIFKENFLGITQEGDNCIIENIGAVYFAKGENKNSVYAYADTPLIITNPMLGYKVSFDLTEFSFDKAKNTTYFSGYSRYEEMGEKKKWLKARRQNYFGSTMHFYRSLTANVLKKEGFSIFNIRKQNKDSVAAKTKRVSNFSMLVPVATTAIIEADTITGKYFLKGKEQIAVQYDEVPHSKFYLSRKILVRGLNRFGFTSYITLLSDKVELDKNGIIHSPLAIIYDGFWVYEKLGNQLPFDYTPD